MSAIDPGTMYPLEGYNRLCFLKNVVTNSKITIGDFTYYDDFETVENFEKNVRYLFDFNEDQLVIGKFCMIGSGVEFIMNGANHLTGAVSAYPFAIFSADWRQAMDGKSYPLKGDTIIGNDVWVGYKASILPGVSVGDGSIIGAYSVVTSDVTPYTIVGGNPAQIIRKRFDDKTIKELLKIAWWTWPIEKITHYTPLLTGSVADFLKVVKTNSERH